MQILRGRTIGVNSLEVSPDSRYVAAGGGATCHLWDLAAAILKARTPDNPGDLASGMAFPAQGVLMTWGVNQLRRHNLDAGTQEAYSSPRFACFIGAILHPSGDSLKARGPGGRHIVSVTLTDGGLEAVESGPLEGAPVLVAFAPDGKRYLCRDYEVTDPQRRHHLRDTATDEVVATFDESIVMRPPGIYVQQRWLFTPDGRRLLVAGNRHIVAHDCGRGGQAVASHVLAEVGQVHALAIDADGRRVATVEDHRVVTLRDADTFAPLRSYDFAMPKVTCVAFTPDGTRCVVGNSRGKVLLFDLD